MVQLSAFEPLDVSRAMGAVVAICLVVIVIAVIARRLKGK
jgi:hypothetical protein